MSTGQNLAYVSGQGHLGLPRADGHVYTKAHDVKPKPKGLDWAALTPRCRKCGEQSGQLDKKTRCPNCRPSKGPTVTAPAVVKAPRAQRTPAHRPHRTDQAQIIQAYQAGMAIEEIKTQFKVGTIVLRRIIADAGVPPRAPLPPIKKGRKPPRPTRTTRASTDVNEAQVITDYRAGQTVYQIARTHGVLPKRIYTILNTHNVPRRDDRANNSGGKRKTYDPAFVARVKELYEAGLSQRQVGIVLGVSEKVIWRCITYAPDITPRPPASVLSMQGFGREQKLPRADHQTIATRYEAGETGPSIAASYGCSAASVYALLNNLGVPRRHTANRPTTQPKD